KPLMPLLKTEAGERDTREKDIEENSNIKILDMVQYSNVIPEKEIRIEGRLMDKDTGEEIPGATSQIAFTPVGESGAIEMEYDLDGQDMAGKTIVAFEKMYYEDNLIATHEDINDEDQSVNIVKREEPTTEVNRTESSTVKPTTTKPNPTESNSPETGDKIDIMLIVLIGIMSVLIALVVLRRRSMKQ
ncbi:MAG: VaFE repeat-containing surface-anchored protein, partial [Bacillota bacterium]|nr:VaFE repeat-containing surface-anchored protein [Bacillota bacterium]